MFLLVLRSVAVYFATAGICLWAVHRFVTPLTRGAALAIAVAPFLLTGRATFTGAIYAPLDIVYQAHPFLPLQQSMGVRPAREAILSDVVYQEIPWRKAVRAAVKRGELPLWNPHVLAGEPLLAVQQPAIFHPGTWIGFLLPLAQAWTFEMSLRIFLALLCGYAFFRELGCRMIPSLIGAVGWAFSNYMVFFLGYPLCPAAAPFPLLLLGLRRLARNPGRGPVAIVVAALLLIVTSGHPESVLHTVAAAGLYFLYALYRAGRGNRGRAVLQSLGAGALTLGISAILLLPLAEALPHTIEHSFRSSWYAHQPRSHPWDKVLASLELEVSPTAVKADVLPRKGEAPFGPYGYCGSLLLPLALTGLLGRRESRWFFASLGTGALLIAVATPLATLLARLPLFDIAINDRVIFATAFSVCVLAAFGTERLLEGEGRSAFLVGSALTVALLFWIFARNTAVENAAMISRVDFRNRILIQIVPVAVAAFAVLILARSPRTRLGLGLGLLAILLVERTVEAGSLYGSHPSRAFYPPLSVLAGIPRGEPYRIASLGYTFIPNVAALYGLEDVRGYEAMTFGPLWQTYPMWCTHQAVWYNRVEDPTTPFLAFLNARWILFPPGYAAPDGWTVRAEGEEMRLLENPRALPRAFVPRLILAEPDQDRRLAALRSVTDFAERGVVSEAGSADWIPNGDASVSIAGYAADRLALDVDAREAALVGTSITSWPGWIAELDGRPITSVPYNHAFLAFRVPAGHHRLALRYFPRSFRVGAMISLVCAVVAGVLAAPRRRARSSAAAD
jgi:hypothetical protein